MPKQDIDYSKSIIYKLKHNTDINDEDVYIGHTTNWIQRKREHKKKCNCITSVAYNQKKYQEIRAKGGWVEWEMLPIEEYPCESKIQVEIREEYWRNYYNANLNMRKAHSTEQERKENLYNYNKKLLPYYKSYREEHKERIAEYKKIKVVCECGCEIVKCYINKHRKTKKHIDLMEQINKNICLIVE